MPRARAEYFCARYGLRVPVLLAPMAAANPPALAAAVANAGGLGAFGALMAAPDAIAAWCGAFRAASNGGFQINLWVPDPAPVRDAAHEAAVRATLAGVSGTPVADPGPGPFTQDFAAQFAALLAARPPVASSVMGLFAPDQVAALRDAGIAWFASAATLADARAAAAAGADAIIAQGAEAGGHRASFAPEGGEAATVGLFALLPQVADAVHPTPVIAAGGIADGRGVAAALLLGASAVAVGTAFLRTPETAAHPAWAAGLADAAPEGTVLTRAFSGRLARGLRNRITEAFAAAPPAPYPVQRALMAPVRAAAEARGDLGCMQAWAGQAAALARAEPAGAVVERLWAEADALLPP